eukprot:4394518-Prymnesium_polylepis.1
MQRNRSGSTRTPVVLLKPRPDEEWCVRPSRVPPLEGLELPVGEGRGGHPTAIGGDQDAGALNVAIHA